MSEVPSRSMLVDEFLAWAQGRPGRFELVNGRVFAMAPERVRHTMIKGEVFAALRDAVRNAGKPCQAFCDGVTVRIDASTAYEPDAAVRCGQPLDGNSLEVPDPLVVVEVLSPSTRGHDTGAKLTGYFLVPSLRHYLIVDAGREVVLHHRRADDGAIETRIVGFGAVELEPPGLSVTVEALLGMTDRS